MNNRLPGRYNTYLFLDSLEHANDSTLYLKRTILESPDNANFIFALPICDRDSIKKVHSIEWKTAQNCLSWLENCGLTVKNYELISPNRDVDIFAFIYERNFKNLAVKCKK